MMDEKYNEAYRLLKHQKWISKKFPIFTEKLVQYSLNNLFYDNIIFLVRQKLIKTQDLNQTIAKNPKFDLQQFREAYGRTRGDVTDDLIPFILSQHSSISETDIKNIGIEQSSIFFSSIQAVLEKLTNNTKAHVLIASTELMSNTNRTLPEKEISSLVQVYNTLVNENIRVTLTEEDNKQLPLYQAISYHNLPRLCENTLARLDSHYDALVKEEPNLGSKKTKPQ